MDKQLSQIVLDVLLERLSDSASIVNVFGSAFRHSVVSIRVLVSSSRCVFLLVV